MGSSQLKQGQTFQVMHIERQRQSVSGLRFPSAATCAESFSRKLSVNSIQEMGWWYSPPCLHFGSHHYRRCGVPTVLSARPKNLSAACAISCALASHHLG